MNLYNIWCPSDVIIRVLTCDPVTGGKLASLEEFKVQKEDLMAKFAGMEDKLKKQEEHHQEVIYTLERKEVVDKDRWVTPIGSRLVPLKTRKLYI